MNKYKIGHLLWGSTLNMCLSRRNKLEAIETISIPIPDKLRPIVNNQHQTMNRYTLHFSFLDVEECKDT